MKFNWWMIPVGLGAAVLASIPAADVYYRRSAGGGCARCHEIGPQYEVWKASAHRSIACVECHQSSVLTNARRVVTHLRGEVPEQVHLRGVDVTALTSRCRSCHQQEFAQWAAGAHSMTMERVFKDRKRPLNDDCLRCHGMHFDGDVRAAMNETGPAIPCLACHSMHRQGAPMTKGLAEVARPSVGLFDRRARVHVASAALPIPPVVEGERRVKMSPDQRQALCYQCHAPLATMQAWSGDDRTPLGVHEGLSCLACHQKHGMAARQSCAGCHPRLSNCGLDVEKMDTTFRDPKSRHNVHTVKCADCHPNGVPKKVRLSGLPGNN